MSDVYASVCMCKCVPVRYAVCGKGPMSSSLSQAMSQHATPTSPPPAVQVPLEEVSQEGGNTPAGMGGGWWVGTGQEEHLGQEHSTGQPGLGGAGKASGWHHRAMGPGQVAGEVATPRAGHYLRH